MTMYEKKTKEKFPDLTKGLKMVADHLLSDPITFAVYPAKKVGEIIGVSETMVIRFCHSVGYSGFSALQQEIREHLTDFHGNLANDDDTSTHAYGESINRDISILKMNRDKIEPDQLEFATNNIISSDKSVIVGFYHSFSIAHWFYINLNYFIRNVHLYRPETDVGIVENLPDLSCVVIFSFYRYAMETIQVAKEAKARGIKIITITDSRVSPVTEYSDIVIPVHLSQGNVFSKGPVTMSIVNMLLTDIVNKLENQKELPSTSNYYVKDDKNNG